MGYPVFYLTATKRDGTPKVDWQSAPDPCRRGRDVKDDLLLIGAVSKTLEIGEKLAWGTILPVGVGKWGTILPGGERRLTAEEVCVGPNRILKRDSRNKMWEELAQDVGAETGRRFKSPEDWQPRRAYRIAHVVKRLGRPRTADVGGSTLSR
jgi:hypothetical protein